MTMLVVMMALRQERRNHGVNGRMLIVEYGIPSQKMMGGPLRKKNRKERNGHRENQLLMMP